MGNGFPVSSDGLGFRPIYVVWNNFITNGLLRAHRRFLIRLGGFRGRLAIQRRNRWFIAVLWSFIRHGWGFSLFQVVRSRSPGYRSRFIVLGLLYWYEDFSKRQRTDLDEVFWPRRLGRHKWSRLRSFRACYRGMRRLWAGLDLVRRLNGTLSRLFYPRRQYRRF